MCVGLAFSKKRMEALGRAAPPSLPPRFPPVLTRAQDATCSLRPRAPIPVPARVPGMVVGTRGARGPVRNLFFFLQEKWAAFLRLAMEGNPLEAEAASCLPHPCSAF